MHEGTEEFASFGRSPLEDAGDETDVSENADQHSCEALERSAATSWDVRHYAKRCSKDGIERTMSSVSSLIGSYTAELDAALPGEPWLRQRLSEMEGKLEGLLSRMAEEVSMEVEREQQHLILMQDQVDKQGQIFSRQVAELHKHMERESTRNSCVSRESKEALADKIDRQGREIDHLRTRLADMEAPFYTRAFKTALEFCWSGCFLSPGRLLLPSRAYHAAQNACCSPVKPRLPE